MTQMIAARELLAQIENKYFRGAKLRKASLTKGDERRAYRLAQVERLLKKPMGATTMAVWLSDEFWTAGEGREPMNELNPLLTLEGLQTLTDDEMRRLRLIQEVAGLCHDLSQHFKFDLKEAFGVRNDFWVSNKRLVEWLYATEHERIAMHTAYIMRKNATGVYAQMGYQPAQDAMAELFSLEYGELLRDPDYVEIPPREYVKVIIGRFQQIERHWRRGRQLKLDAEVVKLHDEICEVVPLRFSAFVLKAAQALFDYMDRELQGRGSTAEAMRRFAEKVVEVREAYLPEGWLADGSLAFGYLMAHAERCGDGLWRKEDAAYDEQ